MALRHGTREVDPDRARPFGVPNGGLIGLQVRWVTTHPGWLQVESRINPWV